MKSGVIVAIAIVVLLAIVGGYFYLNSYDPIDPVCTQDAQLCPDGSYVGRNPSNNCEFFACPPPSANDSDQSQAQTINAEISGFSFSPSTLEINVGDTVVWTNKDSSPHTVTSNSGIELDSPSLSRNGIYSHTFAAAGTFDYHCGFHSGMAGTIIVN